MVSLHGARRARPALRCPTSTIYSHHPVLALEMARKKSREVYEKTSLQKGGESGLGRGGRADGRCVPTSDLSRCNTMCVSTQALPRQSILFRPMNESGQKGEGCRVVRTSKR